MTPSSQELLALGDTALAEGRWGEARAAFEAAASRGESAEACFGMAVASWWLGDNHDSVEQCTRAYALFRRAGGTPRAVECALWLAITYKANFANFAAANGWIERADRLLASVEPGPLHAYAWTARAYRLPDLDAAEALTARAIAVGHGAGDADLELVAISQLGLIRVGKGETAAGFALIDEAMAAVLAGERSSLATVVYVACDMLNACELASDVERAEQWCRVADDFVDSYGCPFLYAECRIYYGSVLAAKGRWVDAERELGLGVRITDGACPGLHARALTRLADLYVRQGRLEDAGLLLDEVERSSDADAELTLSLAALQLARGDGPGASRLLEQRWRGLADHHSHLAVALDLLVEAQLAAGELDAGASTADRLAEAVAAVDSDRFAALASWSRGRVSMARGDQELAALDLEAAVQAWSRAGLPFELARAELELGKVLAPTTPELAIDHVRRALAAFEALGAALEADRSAAFLRSLGVAARTGPKGVGALTRREQEVLQLLGHGLSNPEIAQRIHVTRKTASHHVSSILTKLNLRNRAEIAAYAARAQGPTRAP